MSVGTVTGDKVQIQPSRARGQMARKYPRSVRISYTVRYQSTETETGTQKHETRNIVKRRRMGTKAKED